MVNRIEIIPLEVRGYGNIVTPKTSNDFIGKYNEIYTNIDGDFILSYGGVMLKITSNVSNTIKGLTAGLNVIVTTRDGGVPVSGLTVDCSIDEVSLTSETTDSNGECSFNWSPQIVGDSVILLTITAQDDYAGLTETKEVTIGLLLSFNSIMNDLNLEDDELYIADISEQVESRTQLNPFVKDVWVAEGGEPIVDEYGIIHLAKNGDVIVEQDSLDQSLEYDNVLFEGDVELLTGAVYDMSLSEDYELIVNCLEREDIIGSSVLVTLSASQTSVTYGDTVVLTASVSEDGVPVSGGVVSFYDGVTLLGTDTTDSSGGASLSTSSLSVGSHSLSVEYDDSTSNVVTVTVSDVPAPTPASVSLTSDKSILSYADSESATLSATVLDSSSNPIEGVTVEFFKGSTSLGTASTNSSGVATKSYASAGVGDISLKAQVGSLVSETYAIEDCYLYDTGIADKSSKFATNNVTLTHNTDHYEATTNVVNGTVTLLQNIDNYIAEFDMQSSGTGMGCGVFNSTSNHYNAYYCKMWGTSIYIYTSNGSGTEANKKYVNHNRQDDWYHMLVRKEEDSVTITVSLNGTQVITYTQSISTGINLGMINGYADRTYSFKNIIVKPL